MSKMTYYGIMTAPFQTSQVQASAHLARLQNRQAPLQASWPEGRNYKDLQAGT